MYRGVILLVCCFVTCLLLTKYSNIASSGSGTEIRLGRGGPLPLVAFYFICKIIYPISLRLRPMYAKYKSCAILNAQNFFGNLVI